MSQARSETRVETFRTIDMKMRYSINLHKGATIIFVLFLMYYFENYTIGPYVYFSLHGTYVVIWFFKEISFPDATWDKEIGIIKSIVLFSVLGPCGYWISPYILISSRHRPYNITIAVAISMQLLGIFLHFCSDCQKYFTLKYKRRLISEGLFSRSRNCNYLGEILIYLSFALLPEHWLPIIIVFCFSVFLYYPGMKRKDESLSRYPEFKRYKEQTGILLPKLF